MRTQYPKDAIVALTRHIDGKEDNARLLASAGFAELALIVDAVEGNMEVLELLKNRKQLVIAAFLSSFLTDEKNPLVFLFRFNAAHWAATANAINKDDKAIHWLYRHNMGHYAELAIAIRNKMAREEGSGFESLYRAPI